MTDEENVINLKRCPRFETCSIPKCPLDEDMQNRVELSDDEICILRAEHRTKRVKGIKSATMKGLSKFICKKNLK